MVNKEIPRWAARYLKHDAFAEIDAAVKNAETRTSAEIVPMVVCRSAYAGHLKTLATFLLVFGLYVVLFHSSQATLFGGWFLVVTTPLVFLFPARYLRLWTSPGDLSLQVHRRAQLEFHQAGLTATTGKTGILLFVSLDERRVVVLADKAISDKLPPETWEGVVATIVTGIKAGNLAKGLCQAVGDCSKLLAPHFPRALDDRNELKDSLILAE